MKTNLIIVLLCLVLVGCGGGTKAEAEMAQYRLRKEICEKIRAEMQALKQEARTNPDVKKLQIRFKRLLYLTQARCAG